MYMYGYEVLSDNPKYINYTVVQGDYLYALAKRFDTTVEAIVKANNLESDRLYIGQKIIIPINDSTIPSGKPTLRFGSRGDDVEELQRKLTRMGYSVGDIDGVFGAKTLSAVQAFQKNNGLSPDGIVGMDTWNALEKDNDVTPPGYFTYFVEEGDYLYSLAKKFGTTVDTLMRINNLNNNDLYIGQKLLIPKF